MRKRDRTVCHDEQPTESRPQLEPGQVYISRADLNTPPHNNSAMENNSSTEHAFTLGSNTYIITEEACQLALEAYPTVHPGWKYFFTRGRELYQQHNLGSDKAAKDNFVKEEEKQK